MLKNSTTAALALAFVFTLGLFVGYLFGEGKFKMNFQMPATPPPNQSIKTSQTLPTPAETSPIPVASVDESQLQGPAKWLARAAREGNPRAQYALALDFKNGRDSFKTDSGQAVAWMSLAAAKLAVAQRMLGVWYEQGDGVTKDIETAAYWYLKAANNGDYQAMHNLGYFYAQGLGGLEPDKNLAAKWFKAAADRGLVASQVNLAIVYSQLGQNDQAYLYSKIAADRDPSDRDAPRMRDTFGPMLAPDVKTRMDDAAKKWRPTPIDIIANGGFDTSPEAFEPNAPPIELSEAELKSIQEMLNDQGFKAGTATGQMTRQTSDAIKAFQTKYGLPVTGVANHDLLAAIESIPR